jgi:chromosome partitioning protein
MSFPRKEQTLKTLLSSLRQSFDFVIMDTSPTLGLLTLNALTAADSALIPCPCEFFALEGLNTVFRAIRIVGEKLNPDIRISGVVFTLFEDGEDMSRRIAAELRDSLSSLVFVTMIPRTLDLKESAGHGTPLLLHDILSPGARSYLRLAKEWMGRIGSTGVLRTESGGRSVQPGIYETVEGI